MTCARLPGGHSCSSFRLSLAGCRSSRNRWRTDFCSIASLAGSSASPGSGHKQFRHCSTALSGGASAQRTIRRSGLRSGWQRLVPSLSAVAGSVSGWLLVALQTVIYVVLALPCAFGRRRRRRATTRTKNWTTRRRSWRGGLHCRLDRRNVGPWRRFADGSFDERPDGGAYLQRCGSAHWRCFVQRRRRPFNSCMKDVETSDRTSSRWGLPFGPMDVQSPVSSIQSFWSAVRGLAIVRPSTAVDGRCSSGWAEGSDQQRPEAVVQLVTQGGSHLGQIASH